MNYRQRYSTALFFKKRLIKIIIPFIVWTLFYAVLFMVNPFKTGLRDFFSRCFNTGILSTFWFFIPLLAIYLAMPILSLLKDNRRILWYMFGVSFCLISLLPSLFAYLGLTWNYALAPIMSSGYLIYVVLGYLLASADVSKKKRIAIYILAVFSLLLRYLATLFLSQRDEALNRLFFDYLQYHTVFLAAGSAVSYLFNFCCYNFSAQKNTDIKAYCAIIKTPLWCTCDRADFIEKDMFILSMSFCIIAYNKS